jgi:hypothetical protein
MRAGTHVLLKGTSGGLPQIISTKVSEGIGFDCIVEIRQDRPTFAEASARQAG